MDIMSLINALPGAAAQGLIWGIMAIGVYLTFRILDVADLTVDGTMCTGGAVCIMMLMSGQNIWVSMLAATGAGMLAGLATGIFHTVMGIPAILSGILTQLGLYSVNLKIMGKANQAVNSSKYDLLVSLRNIKDVPFYQNTILIVAVFIVILIAVLYWFFGTEIGCSLRATGCNPNMSRAQGINTDFQGSCSSLQRISCPVSGLCRCEYGPRRYCDRSGSRHHRRGCFRKNIPQLCAPSFQCGSWFHFVLPGSSGSDLDGNRHRSSEASVRTCGCCFSCSSLLESKVFCKTNETRR